MHGQSGGNRGYYTDCTAEPRGNSATNTWSVQRVFGSSLSGRVFGMQQVAHVQCVRLD